MKARTGGKGYSGTLKQQFEYYKKQMVKRIVKEQAYKFARTGDLTSIKNNILFEMENLDYEKVMKKGITRKEGNVTRRYTGVDALRIQIESLRNRASKSVQRNLYVDNFINKMVEVGYSYEEIEETRNILNSLSTDYLTYVIDAGLLPSIEYVYNTSAMNDVMERIRSVGNDANMKSQARQTARKAREYEDIISQLIV